MLYQFNCKITEEDYLAYNIYTGTEKPESKKRILQIRLIFLFLTLALFVVSLLCSSSPFFSVTYAIILGIFSSIYILGYKKFLIASIKNQIQRLKKQGKLPFNEEETTEFFPDKIVNALNSQRLEIRYDGIENVCIVDNQYIYLFLNFSNAIILPISQVRSQADMGQFLEFLRQKFPHITYC